MLKGSYFRLKDALTSLKPEVHQKYLETLLLPESYGENQVLKVQSRCRSKLFSELSSVTKKVNAGTKKYISWAHLGCDYRVI